MELVNKLFRTNKRRTPYHMCEEKMATQPADLRFWFRMVANAGAEKVTTIQSHRILRGIKRGGASESGTGKDRLFMNNGVPTDHLCTSWWPLSSPHQGAWGASGTNRRCGSCLRPQCSRTARTHVTNS